MKKFTILISVLSLAFYASSYFVLFNLSHVAAVTALCVCLGLSVINLLVAVKRFVTSGDKGKQLLIGLILFDCVIFLLFAQYLLAVILLPYILNFSMLG